jgi:hypothetical protein
MGGCVFVDDGGEFERHADFECGGASRGVGHDFTL